MQVVYATRKESPLIVGLGKEESFIASDVPAILRYTRDYYLLEQEEIAVLDHSGVKVYDAYGVEVQKERKTADWDMDAAEKGGYAHFMLKEIHEQPTAIKTTITPRIRNGLPNTLQVKHCHMLCNHWTEKGCINFLFPVPAQFHPADYPKPTVLSYN